MLYIQVYKGDQAWMDWGKQTCRPVWWPTEVDFTDANNTSKRPRMEQLVTIMGSYRNWKTQEQAGNRQMVVDDNPHSPEVPIPVVSTPAAGLISEPLTSSPGVLPSPIHSPGPSTTVTPISNPIDVPASRAWPPLGLTDIVKRRFGTDPVYCTEL